MNGRNRRCVMCWYGIQGSAWIPIESLAGNAAQKQQIKRSVDRLAKKCNNAEDYLQREAPTGRSSGPAKRHYYNICMNLPQGDAPPVASDIASPGDVFFVARGSTFRREVAIYGTLRRTSNQRQTWVYGFAGKRQSGRWVPDPTRAGWVPLRVLRSP